MRSGCNFGDVEKDTRHACACRANFACPEGSVLAAAYELCLGAVNSVAA